MSRLLLRIHDVFMHNGRPAVVLAPASESDLKTSKYSETKLSCAYVNEDGSLGDGFQFDRAQYEAPVQFIDNAVTKVTVTLPADIAQQVAEYRAQVVETASKHHKEDDLEEYHASYGCIHLHKYSGFTRLFMSPFRHSNFVGISVSRAKKYRSLSEDRMHGEMRELVSIFMSEAQFARFITSPMDGNGTPCTIHRVSSTSMPEPPEGGEVERFHEDVEKSASLAAQEFQNAIDFAQSILSKPSVPKKDRETLLGFLRMAQKKIVDSMPFTVRQMRERMEKVVADAQTEVEAHLNRVATAAGFKALTGKDAPIKFLNPINPKKEE
jgi:hypothetical protein